MKNLLLFITLLYSFSISATPQKDILKARYDSCHTYIKNNREQFPVNVLRCARMEIEIGEALEDKSLILTGYIDTGRALFILYQYQMALEYVHKALQLSTILNDMDRNAEAKRLCGAIYTNLDDIYNARKYLNEAIAYYEYKKDTTSLIRSLGTMAISMGKNEQYEECIQVLNKVYKMSEIRKEYRTMQITMLNLSNAYWSYNNPEKGIQLIDSMRSVIPIAYITPQDSVFIQYRIGEYLYSKKQYAEAKKILEKNYEQAKRYKNSEVLSCTLSILIELTKEEKDFEASTKYCEELLNLHDSIEGTEVKKRIGEMEVIYEVSQKNAAIDHLILQNKWNKQRLILILLIIITISAIVIIKIKTNAKLVASKVHLLDEELKNKKNELTNMAIYYYELKKMVANLYVKLKQINYHCKDTETKQSLAGVCTSMAQNSTLDETKNKINNYIDTNYSEYISRLNEKFPELSDSEQRICTMLLIDYTTKEISDVLNISEKSINNIRSKIRKKMDVPENFSISQFLKNI